MKPTRVAVGVFAHNEEGAIANLIQDLRQQDVPAETSVSGIVLANGCTDSTVEVARRETALASTFPIEVENLPQGGKANTWNHFVRRERTKETDTLIFVDGDIRLSDSGTIARLLSHLDDPNVKAVVSEPVAVFPDGTSPLVRFAFERTKSLHENGSICGMLYAARLDALDDILLPNPCLVEDGFLAACLITGLFEHEGRHDVVLAAPDVFHRYEGRSTFEDFFKHSVRLEVGTYMNAALYTPLWAGPDRATRRELMERFARGEGMEDAFHSYQIREDNRDFSTRRLLHRFAKESREALASARIQRLAKQFYLLPVRHEAQNQFRQRSFVW